MHNSRNARNHQYRDVSADIKVPGKHCNASTIKAYSYSSSAAVTSRWAEEFCTLPATTKKIQLDPRMQHSGRSQCSDYVTRFVSTDVAFGRRKAH